MSTSTHTGFKAFAQLIHLLGISTKTNDKLDALIQYFAMADDADKVWTIAMFSGRKPKRFVSPAQLQQWCAEITGHPLWLFNECYHTVGDLSETIALLLPERVEINNAPRDILTSSQNIDVNDEPADIKSLSWYLEQFIILASSEEEIRKQFILRSWNELDAIGRFVFNKLISGNFRIGVSQQLIINALAKVIKQDASVIAHRLSGNWDPASISFSALLHESVANLDASKPYPFYLAYPIEENPSILGNPEDWQVEWKWDGIRGQVIKRQGELFVWSRGEELITEKFPEYQVLKQLLPEGTVLDGEILSIKLIANNPCDNNLPNWVPLPFSSLQTRIGRKNITKKQLQEAPVGFIVYDLLEYNGEDFRQRPMQERRQQLEKIIQTLQHPVIHISPVILFSTWESLTEIRKQSRNGNAEGLMLKRKTSDYQAGRKRGDWWKWKIDPLTIDAVMIYAQKGSGRRSNLYTDYTFAVKEGDKLVPFAKAYSGLTDKEFAEVDNFVKRNSIEKFGPVRTVKPELVFELAFEGIALSSRHKSGVALRFPRMSRWRKDKPASEINTLADLHDMLRLYGNKKEDSANAED
ncbi:MAG: ATP-dependent DNA ligase [Bacteroidota bacterium]